ncbi:MAG: MOSC domain-containing protein [Pseudomonadota bacterium]
MSLLKPTEFYARVTWLGTVADSAADISSAPAESVEIGWDGVEGDCHSGLIRPACVRVRRQYLPGTEIRNTRQISIVSDEDLAGIAADLGLEKLHPSWLGATISIEGVPDFTLVPPNTRLIFEDGTALTVDTENQPCRHPAEIIEQHHPGHGRDFVRKAHNRRGVTAWVERPGSISIGDTARLHVPPRRLHPLM